METKTFPAIILCSPTKCQAIPVLEIRLTMEYVSNTVHRFRKEIYNRILNFCFPIIVFIINVFIWKNIGNIDIELNKSEQINCRVGSTDPAT